MARLHYNLVRTALDGAINSTDTTVTFTTALKEGGPTGTDIPTVASPDVLAIRIDDEILHVTAYTSGTLTATVTRGEDSTVAAGHVDGSTVKHVIAKDDLGASSGASGVVHRYVRRTSVTTSTFTTTTATQLDAALDLTIPAEVGDVLECTLSTMWAGSTAAQYACLDVATIVSAAVVHFFSNGGSVHPQFGALAWLSTVGTNTDTPVGGALHYTVQAGDISGGAVTVRPVGYLSAAGSRFIYVSADLLLEFSVKNLGPVA